MGPPPCGRGMTPYRNTLLPHMRYPAELGGSMSNGRGVNEEIRVKNLTIVSRLSRSVEVIGATQIDPPSLRVPSSHGPISYCFRGDFSRKSQIYSLT